MSAIGFSLLITGTILLVVSGIWLLVAAFQESLPWGFCVLLLPGASLVFVIIKWSRARAPFLASFAGLALVGGAFAFPSRPAERVNESVYKEAQAELMQARVEMMDLEDSVTTEERQLQATFAQLKAKMAGLNSKNTVEVAAYNQEVSGYEAQRKQFATSKDKLAAATQKFNELLEAAPQPVAANIVIYTTKTCGACTTAKAYLRNKNVTYREVDVQSSQAALEEFRKYGSAGVPVIVVGSEVMVGFNPQRLEQVLASR